MTGIILADIDDTILRSRPKDIGVWKYKDGESIRLSTTEYADDPDVHNPDVKFSYHEFEDPKLVRKSILNGTPLTRNLKIIDKYLDKGYDFAFLTARGQEDVIKEVMESFMKYNSPSGMVDIGERFKKGLSYAVTDEKYCEVFDGLSHAERKAEVIKHIAEMYDEVVFIDDDFKNLQLAKNLHLPNLITIQAR